MTEKVDMAPREEPPRLLNSVRRTCERLDLSRTTIYALIGEGRLSTVKVGHKTLITEQSILAVAAGEAAHAP